MGNLTKQSFYVFLLLLFACGQPKQTDQVKDRDTISIITIDHEGRDIDSLVNAETETFYLVEVARGHNYDSLILLAGQTVTILNSKIDFLGRIYKPNRGIILPDSCDDDMYCGKYYPRRPFSDQNFVSIEMQYAYEENKKWTDRDTLKMIVFANIFSSQTSADSVVKILTPKIKTARTLKEELYLGCMH